MKRIRRSKRNRFVVLVGWDTVGRLLVFCLVDIYDLFNLFCFVNYLLKIIV